MFNNYKDEIDSLHFRLEQLEDTVIDLQSLAVEMRYNSKKVKIAKKLTKTDKLGVFNYHDPVEMTIEQAIQLLADAIGMEFKTEPAQPSKTVLVAKETSDE